MRAVDTNVLVRLIVRDDARQTAAAETFIADGAWVSSLVLAECVWVLESVYDLKQSQLQTVLTMLLEHRQLMLQDADAAAAALQTFSAHRGISFTDCLIAAIASKHGHSPTGTFDRKMARVSGVQVLKA